VPKSQAVSGFLLYRSLFFEDEIYADMINYYLFEKAFDKHRDDPEDELRKIMKNALRELKSDNIGQKGAII
jgi:hypothetical protein